MNCVQMLFLWRLSDCCAVVISDCVQSVCIISCTW